MSYYKFMDSVDVDKVTGGSFVFSKSSYFRIMEARWKKAGIGDIGEGYYENHVTFADVKDTDSDTETLRRLRKVGIRVNHANVQFSNIGLFGHEECYIFSISEGVFSKLNTAMCGKDNKVNYSAAVKLKNLKDLCSTIMIHGMFRSFYDEVAPLQKISDHFSEIEKGRVVYKSPKSNINDVNFGIIDSRYVKDPIFRDQSKYRITLMPCPDSLPDRIIVRVPHPHCFITKVFSNKIQYSPDTISVRPSVHDLIDRIKMIKVIDNVEEDLSSLARIIDETILVCWEARKIGHRNRNAESLLLERDIVYGKNLTSSRVNNIVAEITKGLLEFEQSQSGITSTD